jgi:hypothetical protein
VGVLVVLVTKVDSGRVLWLSDLLLLKAELHKAEALVVAVKELHLVCLEALVLLEVIQVILVTLGFGIVVPVMAVMVALEA